MRKLDKDELFTAIEHSVCRWCPNYKGGEFCTDCRLCNISVVYQTIHLLSETEE